MVLKTSMLFVLQLQWVVSASKLLRSQYENTQPYTQNFPHFFIYITSIDHKLIGWRFEENVSTSTNIAEAL